MAQLHWPRLYLASNGFGRLEINYAKIIGRAYPTFTPHPSETEIQAWLEEYARNFLLFLYEIDGRMWGQWDTRKELLPRYKTAADRRSPQPTESAFIEWKRLYREQNAPFPKCFGNLAATFPHGVGVGVGVGVGGGVKLCAPAGADARALVLPRIDDPPFGTTELDARFEMQTPAPESDSKRERECLFDQWWEEYWLKRAKADAKRAFLRIVTTSAKFDGIMTAMRAQKPEMMRREPAKRPHGATWLNGERWNDEIISETYRPPSVLEMLISEAEEGESDGSSC